MKYLCEKHLAKLMRDTQSATTLWSSAMKQGTLAMETAQYRQAQRFYGTALDIAVHFINKENSGAQEFTIHHLADSARALSSTLCTLNQMDEAEEVLIYVHRSLIGHIDQVEQGQKGRTSQLRQMLKLLEEFKKRAVSILKLRGKRSLAETLQMISNQVSARARYLGNH